MFEIILKLAPAPSTGLYSPVAALNTPLFITIEMIGTTTTKTNISLSIIFSLQKQTRAVADCN